MCTLTISFFFVTLDIKENDKPNEPWFDLFKKKKKDLKSRLKREEGRGDRWEYIISFLKLLLDFLQGINNLNKFRVRKIDAVEDILNF